MTRRERILAAVRHEEPDRVPYQVDLTIPANTRLAEYTGDAHYIESIGNHIIKAQYNHADEIRPGYWRDRFGVVWNRAGADKDIGVVEDYLLPEPTLSGYNFPQIEESEWRKIIEQTLERAEDKCAIAAVGFSLFERAWSLRGMENLLIDMVTEPDFVDELLEAICEYNLKIIEIALEYPIDGIHFGDDWGQQKGLIMGPNYWRRFIKPRVAKMLEPVKRAGKFTSHHSCGDISELFGDLIDIGLDVYQTFQPEIYNISEVKQEFGNRLAFWGGISTQRVLPWLSPDEVKQVTHNMIKTMGPGGGYIAGPTHAVPGDVPPENIIAMIEALRD